MYRSICIGLALALFDYARPVQAQEYLDKVVESARKEFNIPGIAVAVVKDGEVVVSKGYGVRRVGDTAPVTPHTLFAIGSNTKLFTSVALAMLVDEGKIDWDDRVVDRLPGFQMSDAYVTREMRIRDLLCHRSGLSLGAGDLMFWPGTDLTMEDINYRLRFVPLATSFRSGYVYDNILYDSAGAVIQRISGKSWSDFMRERILQPLGMRDSKTSIRLVDSSSDVVAPHALVDGKLTPLSHRPLDNMAPAGAIVSSADDMSRWVITLLNKGKLPNGQTLYSEAQARKLWTPLTIIPNEGPLPELAEMRANFQSYAKGDVITEYRGQLMVTHTGGVQGMVSIVEMIPDLKLVVVVLTNQEAGVGLFSIANTVLDHYLSAPPKDWVSSFSAVIKRRHENAESAVKG
jgi:CubicO group peptidase (beta-lactamase class C family)